VPQPLFCSILGKYFFSHVFVDDDVATGEKHWKTLFTHVDSWVDGFHPATVTDDLKGRYRSVDPHTPSEWIPNHV
jgi:hypothetical protein